MWDKAHCEYERKLRTLWSRHTDTRVRSRVVRVWSGRATLLAFSFRLCYIALSESREPQPDQCGAYIIHWTHESRYSSVSVPQRSDQALHEGDLSRLGPRVPEHDDLVSTVARDVDLVAVYNHCRDITFQIDIHSL